VISESSKANHDTGLVGPPCRIFLIGTDINQEGGDNQYMDQIDPQVRTVAHVLDNRLIAVVNQDKDTKSEDTLIGPARQIGAEKSNEEEHRSDEQDMEQSQNQVNVHGSTWIQLILFGRQAA